MAAIAEQLWSTRAGQEIHKIPSRSSFEYDCGCFTDTIPIGHAPSSTIMITEYERTGRSDGVRRSLGSFPEQKYGKYEDQKEKNIQKLSQYFFRRIKSLWQNDRSIHANESSEYSEKSIAGDISVRTAFFCKKILYMIDYMYTKIFLCYSADITILHSKNG